MKNTERLMTTIRMLKGLIMKPNFSELARTYNVDRRTVKKYWEEGGVPKRKKKEEYSRWDPYEDTIRTKAQIPGISIRGIHEYFCDCLGEESIPGGYNSLVAYMKKKGIAKHSTDRNKPHVHYETDMGEQIQVDWIEKMKIRLKSGEVVHFNIFSATLGWSREHIFIYSPTVTTEDFIRCMLDTFRKLGGVPKKVLTDNMSAIVKVRGRKKSVNPEVTQFFKDLDVKLELCKVRTPQTKGKCESANRFRSWVMAWDGELKSVDELIHKINDHITRRINEKVNEATNIPPAVLFQKEKEYLSPLPNKVLLESYLDKHCIREVPPTLLVTYKGNGYSVPKKHIGQRVHLYATENELYIYDDQNKLITIHSISTKKKNYHLDHYESGLNLAGKSKLEIREIAQANLKRFDEEFANSD